MEALRPRRRTINWERLNTLPEAERQLVLNELAAWQAALEENPLQGFWPHPCKECESYVNEDCEDHRTPQLDFLRADTPVQAAFAGNQFGKTTALVVKCFIQHLPLELLPEHLHKFKLVRHGQPVRGRLLCPSEDAMVDVTIPAMQKWAPRNFLRGGTWDSAWDKSHHTLNFKDGGKINVYTYRQDPEVMVGATLDYVGYDEPPPKRVRSECAIRLVRNGGFEMFAMTPVNRGAGIGYIYQEIYRKREHPDYTVVMAAIHDNPLLDKRTVERILSLYSKEEREAREFGHFVPFGGLIYANFERGVIRPLAPERVRQLETVVGIDPGLRNAALIWVGFDRDSRGFVYHEELLQDKTPEDYALAIWDANARWGINTPDDSYRAMQIYKRRYAQEHITVDQLEAAAQLHSNPTATRRPLYVIDPSAASRSLTSGESVETELLRLGVPVMRANNNVEAGIQQVRLRLSARMLLISSDCRGLRDEADLYHAQDRPDGEFKPVKEHDHRLDALRYAVMSRPWNPVKAMELPQQQLGFKPDFAPPWEGERPGAAGDTHPLGSLA
jgi:phage terminase large subunit-like protein